MTTKIITIENDSLVFEDGTTLSTTHEQDCCESHWLDFSGVQLDDFSGLEFNLNNDSFFERVKDYGIRLIPINGHPIGIPGYGHNNGYYSSNLTLVLESKDNSPRTFDITECQIIDD